MKKFSATAHFVLPMLLIVGLLAAWEFVLASSSRGEFLFSKPSQVFDALINGLNSGPLINDAVVSGHTTLLGVAIGLFVGVVIALISVAVARAVRGIEFSIGFLATLPILAIAPLFLVWFGTGLNLKIAIAAYLAILVVAREVFQSREAIEITWSEFRRFNPGPQSKYIIKIFAPLATAMVLRRIPETVNAAFLGTFIGEFIAADQGLGYRVLRASSLYQVDLVLATAFLSVVVLLFMQFGLERSGRIGIALLQKWTIPSSSRSK